jgi:hypothetical protein
MMRGMSDLTMEMVRLVTAKLVTRPLWVAAKLGIADLLADGPRPVAELATATHTHAQSLYRVLRALASVGIFAETDPKVFTLTPLAEMLKDGPRSMRNLTLWINDPRHDHVFENLLHSVQTGETAVQKTHGVPVWEWLGQTPDLQATFNAAMTNNAHNMHGAAVHSYDFSRFKKLVDVGGGHGHLIAQILDATPGLHGVVFDQPHVVEGGRAQLAAGPHAGRAEAVGGDFFAAVPEADAHVMSFIIHDWYDPEAVKIIQTIHKAQPADGTLLLLEIVIPEGNTPSFGKILDIEMLAMAGGRERTEAEFRHILAEGGYRLEKVIPTPSPISIIEAKRV